MFVDIETIHLRLGVEPMCWDSNLAKTQFGTLNLHDQDSNTAKTQGLPTKTRHLVSGLNEAQVIEVSLQKKFSERQSDR